MENMIKKKLADIHIQIAEFKGPSLKERWLYWKSMSSEQLARAATVSELEKLTKSFDVIQINIISNKILFQNFQN
jgi:hypothetical protein